MKLALVPGIARKWEKVAPVKRKVSRTQIIEKMLSFFLAILVVAPVQSVYAMGRDRERPLRPGRPQRRGNEASQPVSQVTLGTPVYGGSGCPQGSMRAVFAPDNLSFSLLFDQFIAEVVDPANAKKDTMSCDLLIPIQIPEGMQMEITRVDLRGFANLPNRGRGVLHSVFNFRGRGGDGDRMNLRFNFQGPLVDNYELSSDVMTSGDAETSPCGGAFNLRVLNELKVQTPRKGEPASLTLDSVDGTTEAVYFVNWRQCSQPSRTRLISRSQP